jgi:hypothetical protein
MVAFASNILPNLVDWARSVDPDGAIADIAELLSQCNEVLKDIIWHEGNLPLGHKISVRAGLPQGTWRGNNQGVASTKPLQAQYQFSIGELVDYSLVDKSEATLNGNVDAFRYSQDMAHIEGLSQQVASAFFYSNEATNPQQFTGLSPYYNTTNTANAKNAANVLSGGGSGSANASMWLAGWGDRTLFGLFPKGSPAGLQYEDKGDVRALYDINGNQFEGYTSYFCWKLGLCVADWRYTARLANVDTTTAAGGLFSTTPPDLFVYMARMVVKFPTMSRRVSGVTETDAPDEPSPGINPAWYCNRTIRESLDIQAIRDKNVLISSKDFAGDPVMQFRDVPIRVVDALTNSEATLS